MIARSWFVDLQSFSDYMKAQAEREIVTKKVQVVSDNIASNEVPSYPAAAWSITYEPEAASVDIVPREESLPVVAAPVVPAIVPVRAVTNGVASKKKVIKPLASTRTRQLIIPEKYEEGGLLKWGTAAVASLALFFGLGSLVPAAQIQFGTPVSAKLSFSEVLKIAPQSQVAALSGIGSGLRAHYSFEEGSGTSVNDVSGNNKTATMTGGGQWVTGKLGGGMKFSGSALVTTPLSVPSYPVSVCAWINMHDVGQLNYIARSGAFQLFVVGYSAMSLQFYNALNTAIGPNGSVALNTWQHVCGTVTSAYDVVLYVNGTSVATSNVGPLAFQIPFTIGEGMNGTIDEVRIYDRALSSAEITQLYTSSQTVVGDTQPPTAPPNFATTEVTYANVKLSWGDSVDAESGIGGYRVYRDGVQITSTTNNDYTDTNVSPSSNYVYTIKAYDTSSNLSAASTVNAATPAIPSLSVSNTAASAITYYGATITWNTTLPANSQVEYGLTTSYGKTTTLKTTLANSHSHVIAGLNPNTTYHYRVKSRSDIGSQTVESADMTFTTTAASAGNITDIIPASRLADWRPGVTVGVVGGIPTNRTNIIDVTQAPYFASRSMETTTGSIAKGSKTLTVANIKDFKVGDTIYIQDAFAPGWDLTFKLPLFTKIEAISGTTITIADATGHAVTGALVAHDAGTVINAAIAAAPPESVIYLPAGTYPLYTSISLQNNLTIRGAGNSTVLTGPGSAIHVGTGFTYVGGPGGKILGSPRKGASVLTLDNVSSFASYPNGGVGYTVYLTLLNDPALPVMPQGAPDNFMHSRRQMTRVTAVNAAAKTVTISPPLYYDMPASLEPTLSYRVLPNVTGERVGIEDLVIDMTNTTYSFGIRLQQTFGTWVKGVTVLNTPNYHIFVEQSLNCEIRESYFSTRKGGGTNGAAILFGDSSGCLVEDNIVHKQFPHLEINSSTGNVFGYNYLVDSIIFGFSGISIDTNHGPHSSHNLYEGNSAPNVMSDGYFGGSSDDTMYRNWLHGTQPGLPGQSYTVALKRFTRNYNFVGNLLGTAGGNNGIADHGYPNIGNGSFTGTAKPSAGDYWDDWMTGQLPNGYQEQDLDVEATLVQKFNWHGGIDAVPTNESIGSVTLPASLYRTTKPAFMSGFAWPPFEPTNPNLSMDALPAGYRYNHGTLPESTVDDIDIPTTTNPETIPNPSTTPSPSQTASPDSTSPSITSILVSPITTTSLTISWLTNEAATTRIEYGLTASYGSVTPLVSALTTGHTQTITGLTPGTLYYYRVVSSDGSGNTTISDRGEISTLTNSTDTTTLINKPPANIGGTTRGGGGGGGGSSNTNTTPGTPNTVPCTPSSSVSPFTRTLQLGSTGADVKALQQFLNSKGYKVSTTGAGSPGQESSYFGPKMKAAVTRFQSANNIAPTSGSFGPLTRTKVNQLRGTTNTCAPINSLPAAASGGGWTRTLQLGSTGADVKALQQFLNAKGFRISATGTGSPGKEGTYFGPATKAALIKFQKANNIVPASGVFGPLTRAKVNQLK
jgi:hypothetical protein